MTRARMIGVAAVCLGSVVGACSVEGAMNAPRCNGGSVVLAAQSVAGARWVPCFEDLPDGWAVTTVDIGDRGTVVTLDSDRAGLDAATLRFEDACDLGRAVSVPSDLEVAERFDDIERLEPGFRASTYYRFDGGCVTWRFDFDDGVTATESVELEGALTLVSRDDLNATLRENFLDVDL